MIRAVAIKCNSGKLHHVAYPALFTENNRAGAVEMAEHLDRKECPAKCSPHKVVTLLERRAAKEE